MLEFVQHNQPQERSPFKKLPQLAFGVSLESPEVFIKPHTMISNYSYINPYVKLNI